MVLRSDMIGKSRAMVTACPSFTLSSPAETPRIHVSMRCWPQKFSLNTSQGTTAQLVQLAVPDYKTSQFWA
jgi:hypothetical protein